MISVGLVQSYSWFQSVVSKTFADLQSYLVISAVDEH